MNAPIVQMSRLRVRDEHGTIDGLDLALPSGPIGALIGSPTDGTTALAGAFAGRLRPDGGTLTVSGRDPRTDPSLRLRTGVLLGEPDLPDVGRVLDLLVLTRRLRGGEAPREAWYVPLGLERLSHRALSGLTRTETRTIGLGLALAVPAPVALVLVDPLGDVAGVSAEGLRPLLKSRAEAGACVLVLCSSTRDACALADDVATLDAGRISRAIGKPDVEALTPGSPVELHVWCDMGRAFASALLLAPEIAALNWSSSDGSTPVRIHGEHLEGCARAVVRIAIEQGVSIRAMQPVIPSKAEVSAATAGIALATRQNAAYVASLGQRGGGAP